MERRKLLIGLAAAEVATHRSARGATTGKPAMLGGTPVRTEAFPSWPIIDDTEERALTGVLRSGKWGRGVGNQVNRFEQQYAQAMGAKHCLAAANGTSALLISLQAMGIGPGGEVIVPPYTFVATINTILAQHALPVFVDTDLETFQIDARKIEAAITPRTVAIMPVHLGGNVADLDTIMAISRKRNIPVLEDACQAHLAEWKNRKVGTLGTAGTFSFQASKNLNSGEGGAVLTNDPEFVERCFAFHNNGRGRNTAGYDFSYLDRGLNLRLTEFQAALLIAQMNRLEKQSSVREQNAAYLNKELAQIAGTVPAKQYAGTTRNAYHLYMFRYEAARFNGLPRNKFLKAMQAEGIPVSGGYSPLNKEPFLRNTLTSKGFKRIYSETEITGWQERNLCPVNDRLCGEAVWLTQTMLLGPRSDMEQIVAAVRKVQQNSAELANA